jgi:hypothetical protein
MPIPALARTVWGDGTTENEYHPGDRLISLLTPDNVKTRSKQTSAAVNAATACLSSASQPTTNCRLDQWPPEDVDGEAGCCAVPLLAGGIIAL